LATQVNSKDGLCTRRDGRFREFGIETPGVRRDVHGDRQRAGVENGAGRSDEGVVGEDHFISGADAEGGYGDFESGRTVGHGNAVFGAVKFGECLFKGGIEFELRDTVHVHERTVPRMTSSVPGSANSHALCPYFYWTRLNSIPCTMLPKPRSTNGSRTDSTFWFLIRLAKTWEMPMATSDRTSKTRTI